MGRWTVNPFWTTFAKISGQVIVGKDRAIDHLLIALLCSGHVLIEDMPGLGKTTMVSALAASLGCSFRRIQFTPDVLPSDITGFTMFNLKTGEQEFHPGSVMNQIVLADETTAPAPKRSRPCWKSCRKTR